MVKPVAGEAAKYTDDDVLEIKLLIGRLHGYCSAREAKFNRNLNRYYNTGRNVGDPTATIWDPAYQTVGFNRMYYDDSSLQARLNIIKSAVDTVCSKLSQARVRPFFDAVRGDYDTIKAARSAQIFFDAFFDTQKIYERAPEVAKGAMLFDGGHFWIDEDQLAIMPLPHWELYVNPYEVNSVGFRNAQMAMVRKIGFPVSVLRQMFPKHKELEKFTARDAVCEYVTVYDIEKKRRWYICNKEVLYCKKIDYERIPVTCIWWSPPILGWSTTCLADDLYTIQVGIDDLQQRIDAAFRQSPFNTVYVPQGSGIKATMLTNEAAQIVEYMPGPGGETPVVATPAPISPAFMQERDAMIQKGYEFAGISQLSAQSKKPAGVTAGVALQTLEDVESERHNVTVQAYIHQFVEIAEIAVEVFPGSADILPESLGRAKVKWADIKKQRDTFRVQFSAGSALAKDPATKIEQIQNIQKLGIDLQPILPQLLEIPDLETAYSATTASYDYVQATVQHAAETGDVDFLQIVDMEMLFREIVRWMLRLSSDGGAAEANKTYLKNLAKLLDAVIAAQKETEEPVPEPVPPVPPPIEPVPPGPVPAGPIGGM